jgi:peptidoglycan/xylan/chitin deacetylase (PgdA/CDA1 family)
LKSQGYDLMRNSLPVLTYHSIAPGAKIDPALLEIHLKVLADSGLPSLLPNQLADSSNGFLLTFDDGFADLWTHAYPLLEKYSIKAVVFVIPSRVGRGPVRPQSARAFGGSADMAHREASAGSGGHPAFLRWSELTAMEKSGLINVQSHSYYHRMGWIGDQITGFHLPPNNPAHWSLGQATSGDERPGIPIYRRGSALGHRLYYDDLGLRDFLATWLAKNSLKVPADPKQLAALRRRLFELTSSYRNKYPRMDRWETDAEREDRTMEDILKARRAIEERLGGDRDELCLPWGQYDTATLEVARKAGIRRIYTLDRGSNSAGRLGFTIRRFEPRPRGKMWLKNRLWIYRCAVRAELYRLLSRR